MIIVDAHAHHFFYENLLEKVLLENKRRGVKYIVENGLNPKTNRTVLEEARKYDLILPALGYHPTDISNSPDEEILSELNFIEKESRNIVAIGEVGLDFYWVKDEQLQKKQITYFEKILELAERVGKPVIVHSRAAEKECIDILTEYDVRVVLHSYGGKLKYAKRAIDLGIYFSIPAIVYKVSHFQRLAYEVPLELLLVETDSPFLDPIEHRKNASWKIIYGLKKIAEIKCMDVQELVQKIYENFLKFFNIRE